MSKEIRTKIDDDLQEKVDVVKKHYGLKNDSELVRFLISKTYNEIIIYEQLPDLNRKPRESQEAT